MKNTILIVILIVIVGLGIYFFSTGQDQETPEIVEQEDVIMEDESMMADEGEVTNESSVGSYEEYSPEKLARADDGEVVLFFKADWCPTCRSLDADITSNIEAIPRWLTILDVDYDEYDDLKMKYGITYQHTFVQVDSEGNQLKKWTMSPTLADLVSEVI